MSILKTLQTRSTLYTIIVLLTSTLAASHVWFRDQGVKQERATTELRNINNNLTHLKSRMEIVEQRQTNIETSTSAFNQQILINLESINVQLEYIKRELNRR